MERDSFVFYRSFFNAISMLEEKEQLKAFQALCKYALDGEEENISGGPGIVLMMARPQIDANNERYKNGKKGGRPKAIEKPSNNQMKSKSKPTVNLNGTKEEPTDIQTVSTTKPNVNENENENEKENVNVNEIAPAQDPGLAHVMEAYMNHIDPLPTEKQLDMLKGYVDTMGADVCLRAIERAIDANARNWNYIRAILQNCQKDGICSIADWDRKEEQRNGRKRDAGGDADPAKTAIEKWKLPRGTFL